VAALSASVAAGVGKVGESALVDAYQGLKAALKRGLGDGSEVVKAVDTVEEDPKSDWRKGMLKEKVEISSIDEDSEVREAAQKLLDQVRARQYARGNYIARADSRGHAEVRVNQPKE
jgi:hypothetical protein